MRHRQRLGCSGRKLGEQYMVGRWSGFVRERGEGLRGEDNFGGGWKATRNQWAAAAGKELMKRRRGNGPGTGPGKWQVVILQWPIQPPRAQRTGVVKYTTLRYTSRIWPMGLFYLPFCRAVPVHTLCRQECCSGVAEVLPQLARLWHHRTLACLLAGRMST